MHCVVPENIHTPLVEVFVWFDTSPDSSGNFSFSSYFHLKSSKRLLRPSNNYYPLWCGYKYFLDLPSNRGKEFL